MAELEPLKQTASTENGCRFQAAPAEAAGLEQLGVSADLLKQEQANIAAGYAVTYVCGYILVLLYVPLIAPWLMGRQLKAGSCQTGGRARRH